MRILYIDVDSLRPDHLGCYGYHRNTSPVVDQIAAEGVVFENVYTSDAPCQPSRTAFYSGRFGIQTGVVGHGGTAAEPKIHGPTREFSDRFDAQGLARKLQDLGFHTTLISPFGQRHAAHWFYAGFHEMHNTGKRGMESAEEVLPHVEKWLEANATRDQWYLHINLWDPHTPYRVPMSFGEPFADDPIPAWLDDDELIRRHNQFVGPHTAQDIGMYDDSYDPKLSRSLGSVRNRQDMRKMINGYDTGVRYADQAIGEIIARLKAAGVYEETVVIVSADHGENLGELGLYAEHATADQGTCRVPLIIKFPGAQKGIRDAALHYQLDLAPTLMELLGGKPAPIWDGQSFASTIRTGAEAGRGELVIGQCAHVCQRSVRWDKWLYIRTYHDGFHLFPEEMLFDIATDPHEQNDLAAERPDLCREGLVRLTRWHEGQMRRMIANTGDAQDPLWTVMKEGGPHHGGFGIGSAGGIAGVERYLKRLETTGRAEGAEKLRAKYARELGRAAK